MVPVAAPAVASPGEWTQVSQISSSSRYPDVSISTQPSMGRFGDQLQVVWRQEASSSDTQYWSAIVDRNGTVTRSAFPIVTGWAALTNSTSIIDLNGQRLLTFSGLPDGLGGATRYATSGDGVAWTVQPGSLSETNTTYNSNGGSTVNAGGTPIWVGTPGINAGLTWHVGLSGSNPAPQGSDIQFTGLGCCSYDAEAAYDASTGTTWAAFYSNNSGAPGVYVGPVSPGAPGFQRPPGVQDSAQQASITARPGGGIFTAYLTKAQSFRGTVRVWNASTGTTWDIPDSESADNVTVSAGTDGRVYVVWESGGDIRAVVSNRAGTAFGAQGSFGGPQKGATIYFLRALGGNGRADVLTMSRVGQANVWHGQVQPTLTVSAKPAVAKRGRVASIVVQDAGDPVSGAKVRVAGRTVTTGANGTVKIKVPNKRGAVRVEATKAGFNAATASIRIR